MSAGDFMGEVGDVNIMGDIGNLNNVGNEGNMEGNVGSDG